MLPVFINLTLISVLACLFMTYVPAWAFLGGLGWGITLLSGGYYLSAKQLSLIFVLNVLLLIGLAGSSNLFFMLIFGAPALVMGVMLSQKRGYYQLQKWGMFTVVLLVSLFLGLAYFLPASSGSANLQLDMEQYVADTIQIAEDSGLLTLYAQQGISPDELKIDLEQTARWSFMHRPAFYYLEAMLAVCLTLRLSRWVSGRIKKGIELHKKPFREEMMPWQLAWLVIMALALWLRGRDTMNNVYYVGSNLLVLAAPITFYYGLANLAYLRNRLQPQRRKMATLVLVGLVLIYTIPNFFFICLLGLFDSLIDYRKLSPAKEAR
jgi:hypothetical protein